MHRATKLYSILILCFAAVTACPAQTFTSLVNFNGSNGAYPTSIIQATDGNLWGATNNGGTPNCGIVFKMTMAGALTKVYSFNCTSSGNEGSGLIQGVDGDFYGTTFGGGSNSSGTAFKLTPAGMLTTLYNFTGGADGASPVGSLVQGTDGNFYGAAYGGGDIYGYGALFKVTPTGKLTSLYDFDFTHGAQPYAGLIQATNGSFYGTTYSGGAGGQGTVIKVTSKGTFGLVYSFVGTYGAAFPVATVVQGKDGNFYGTTPWGGPANDGTIFKVSPSGAYTDLHDFSQTDGRGPSGALIQATDGNFYGTTSYGGLNDQGTVFRMTPTGTITTLHNFNGTDGALPFFLVQDTNGSLYGLTNGAGAYGYGTIFRLDVGLAPFVETQTTSGKAGQTVNILGQGFTGTTGVKFGSGSATFTIVSSTYITATIPTSGTTGFITVTMPTGTLKGNKSFKVIPTLNSFSPTSGSPGTIVTITGTGLAATTKVTFGGVKAAFTVNSGTQVTATVPSGAVTGKIAITTTGGTASKGIFTVF